MDPRQLCGTGFARIEEVPTASAIIEVLFFACTLVTPSFEGPNFNSSSRRGESANRLLKKCERARWKLNLRYQTSSETCPFCGWKSAMRPLLTVTALISSVTLLLSCLAWTVQLISPVMHGWGVGAAE